MKAFRKLLAANIKQFLRERMAVFWTFAFPIFFILIFGAVFGGGGDAAFDVGLAVEDNSAAAQQVSEALQQVPFFRLHTGDQGTELQELKSGDRRAVIVIPPGFGQTISQSGNATIDVYYDPTQSSSVQAVLPIITQVLEGMGQPPPLIDVNPVTLQAQAVRTIDWMVPGILGMALMQLGLFAVTPLVVQRENRVLKRLGATPLRRSTMILSTVVFRLLIAIGQTVLIIIVARSVFHVPMLGSYLFLAGMVALGALTFLAMGFGISAFVKTQEAAQPLLMAVQFPMMFLSGIFFPPDVTPGFMRPIMDIMPLTYLGDSFRQIMVESSAYHPQLVNIAVLAGWLVVSLMLAVRFFKWE